MQKQNAWPQLLTLEARLVMHVGFLSLDANPKLSQETDTCEVSPANMYKEKSVMF